MKGHKQIRVHKDNVQGVSTVPPPTEWVRSGVFEVQNPLRVSGALVRRDSEEHTGPEADPLKVPTETYPL